MDGGGKWREGANLIIAAILLATGVLQASTNELPDTVPDSQENVAPPEDIIVTGLRDNEDPNPAVTDRTLGSNRTGQGAVASRSVFSSSQRFARCAMQRSPVNLEGLRKVLDGQINSSPHRYAQRRLTRAHASCTQDPGAVLSKGAPSTIVEGYNATYYDRGALFIEAIQTFAPDLTLTETDTHDAAVQARFNAREVPLAKTRLPVDRQYFEMAVCLVRLQPKLSVSLVTTNPSLENMNKLEAAIVNRARVCTGGAQRVYFDGTQFRFYIADAVYRWAVAVRGVDTLIPMK